MSGPGREEGWGEKGESDGASNEGASNGAWMGEGPLLPPPSAPALRPAFPTLPTLPSPALLPGFPGIFLLRPTTRSHGRSVAQCRASSHAQLWLRFLLTAAAHCAVVLQIVCFVGTLRRPSPPARHTAPQASSRSSLCARLGRRWAARGLIAAVCCVYFGAIGFYLGEVYSC